MIGFLVKKSKQKLIDERTVLVEKLSELDELTSFNMFKLNILKYHDHRRKDFDERLRDGKAKLSESDGLISESNLEKLIKSNSLAELESYKLYSFISEIRSYKKSLEDYNAFKQEALARISEIDRIVGLSTLAYIFK